MLKYLTKRPRDANSEGESQKRTRLDWGSREPHSFVVWNCNGLPVRLNSGNKPDIVKFLDEHSPDLFCLGEVRAAALCRTPGSKKGDGRPRVHSKIGEANEAQKADKRVLDEFVNDVSNHYCVYYSLAEYKYAGTAILVRKSAVRQPRSIRYNLDMDKEAKLHEIDGRVIFMEWESISVLHCYAPNNGWQRKGFERRELWDANVKSFLSYQRGLGKSVLWCGDLNIAPLDCDLSHPSSYKKQIKATPERPPPKYVGQPGCTPGERESFADIIEAGGLVDLYRFKNPADPDVDIMGPYFTWRGSKGADGFGKYYRRGMRIDHFLAPKSVLERVESCVICGYGADKVGFMGSDHSPMKLNLKIAELCADPE